MAKPKTNRRANVSRMDALRLHAEANKSDPFAAKRMAMTFARDGYKEIKEVHAESKRILDARDAAIKAAYAEWIKTPEGDAMREFVRSIVRGKVHSKFDDGGPYNEPVRNAA